MKKGHFFEKRAPKTSPPSYSIPFLSVLHQNQALHNFCKSGQRSIVECHIGLEYALVGAYETAHENFQYDVYIAIKDILDYMKHLMCNVQQRKARTL